MALYVSVTFVQAKKQEIVRKGIVKVLKKTFGKRLR